MGKRKTHKVEFPYGRDGGFRLACGQEMLFMNNAGVLTHAINSTRWKRVTCKRCLAKRKGRERGNG